MATEHCYQDRDTCRYCADPLTNDLPHGLCDECWRWSNLIYNVTDAGDVICPLCVLEDGAEAFDSVASVRDHIRSDHGVDPEDDLEVIAETQRLVRQDADQAAITEFTP